MALFENTSHLETDEKQVVAGRYYQTFTKNTEHARVSKVPKVSPIECTEQSAYLRALLLSLKWLTKR